MTVAVKNNNKAPLVVPPAVRRKAGFRSGAEIEFKASGGVITITPKLPTAADECTPRQRRIIDARLAQGVADIKAGRTFGPFETADAMVTHMESQVKRKTTAQKSKRSR